MSSSYHWTMIICVHLLFGLLWVHHSWAFNEDKPIYKWSPRWFSGFADRYQSKRYNEDKPIYKWHPIWLYRNNFGKRVVPIDECIPEFGRCYLGKEYQQENCCLGMECYKIDYQAVCVNSLDSDVVDYNQSR